MSVAVIVPLRLDCPHREAAWAWVRGRYESEYPEWEIVPGDAPAGPWVKALAVSEALSRTDADRLVIADADVWVDNLTEAVGLLEDHPLVIPHTLLKRLDQRSTERVLAGRPSAHKYERDPYVGRMGGGITLLRRSTWNEVPMDPRFIGWGQEDDSWCFAFTAILGRPITRLRADMIHLWHPPQARKNRSTGSTEGRDLHNRYEAAAHRDVDAMRALLAEFAEEMAA